MRSFSNTLLSLAAALLIGNSAVGATPNGRAFPSADAAAKALVNAAKSDDVAGLIAILGSSSKEILATSDAVADRQIRRAFVERAAAKIKLVADPKHPGAKTLLVGKDDWPLPIPIIRVKDKWYFDMEEGKDEILARRIGSNELDAIEVCRGYVEAQNNYADDNRAGNIVYYAQKIMSSPGKRDGLYWTSSGNNDESPIGEFVSRAFAEGYTSRHEPYHGYFFKILTAQGLHASGGSMSYIRDGLMTRGFALIAWPADYGVTGVMTFLVDKAGIVYQKDLGPKTAEMGRQYTRYDPDETWAPVANSASK
jgi:hypothetical protein